MTTISVPEWGGDVRVKELTGRQRELVEADFVEWQNGKPSGMMRAKIASWCVVDDNGERVFVDGDVAKLADGAAGPLDAVFDAVMAQSGMTAGAREALEKN